MTIPRLCLSPERRTAVGLFAFLAIVYVYVFPRWADPNQDSRLKMVVAVVDDGTFQIDRYLGATVDYAKVNGHYYSDKAPGVAFIGIPIYAALRSLPILDALTDRLENSSAFQSTLRPDGSGVNAHKVRFALAQVVIAFMVGVLPTALMSALMYLWLAQVSPNVTIRWLVALGYGLLTPVYAYANSMYGHQLSAALLFGAFYVVSTARRALHVSTLLGVGGLMSYAVVTEYPAAVITGVLFIYTAYRLYRLGQWRSLAWAALSAAGVAAGWMMYNTYIFGGPLNLGYNYSELWLDKHNTGFMSLSLPQPEAMWGITFGLFRGLFPLAPWLLLAFPGFALWWRSGEGRAEWIVAVMIPLALFLFNASSAMWWGGFAIGPRYLLPMLPFFVLATSYAFRTWTSQGWIRFLIASLCLWSWVATWGLALAEQAFPSDTIRNPLLEYALPNLLAGNIARNMGTLLGLHGLLSLLPLAVLGSAAAAIGYLLRRNMLPLHSLSDVQLANH